MSLPRWIALLAGCLLWLPTAARSAEPLKVVAYLPDYRLNALEPDRGRFITDAIFFSIAPEPGKPLDHPALQRPQVAKLLKHWRDDFGVRVTFTVGGWNRSQGFARIAATAESRAEFVRDVLRFCDQHGFSGVDLDWEHPENAAEVAAYGALIHDLKQGLGPDRTVTAAVAGWQHLPETAWKELDAVHLMAYDNRGRHSTLESAQKDVARLISLGVPPERIRLGLPLYGRGIEQGDRVLTYAEIVDKYHPADDVNEVDGLFFNGPDLIRQKLDFCREQKLGGVMLWEIGQDARGDASLLQVISEATKAVP
ncbi:hypothetical protein GC163_17645 [bacterium]|nr:hypothetical protein [bacterium]